jgi:hypothetical protein
MVTKMNDIDFTSKNTDVDDIPQTEVSHTPVGITRGKKQLRYLKGPILLSSFCKYCDDAAFRLYAVISAYSSMLKQESIKVTSRVQSDAGIVDRKMLYRAIKKLELRGIIEVVRSPGSKPVVKLITTLNMSAE